MLGASGCPTVQGVNNLKIFHYAVSQRLSHYAGSQQCLIVLGAGLFLEYTIAPGAISLEMSDCAGSQW